MQELTKAEEQIMMILWKLEEAVVKDIIAQIPEPKPAYNTVSTIVRILENKGVVSHRAEGRKHIYYPLLSKNDYKNKSLSRLVKDYFAGSLSDMVSFFSKKEKLDIKEMETIMQLMQEEIDKSKKNKKE